MKIFEESYQMQIPKDPNRSGGLHLSTILRDLALKTGVLAERFNAPIEEGDTNLICLGMAFEDFYAKHHPEMEYHLGELKLAGIPMSPDGFIIAEDEEGTERIELAELKLTKKSSRTFYSMLKLNDKKCRQWLWQIKAYRYAINQIYPEHGCNTARLIVCFVNGDYDLDFSKRSTFIRIYRIEFTDEELAENWQMVIAHREDMLAEGWNEDGSKTVIALEE